MAFNICLTVSFSELTTSVATSQTEKIIDPAEPAEARSLLRAPRQTRDQDAQLSPNKPRAVRAQSDPFWCRGHFVTLCQWYPRHTYCPLTLVFVPHDQISTDDIFKFLFCSPMSLKSETFFLVSLLFEHL
jgi:hypothetical protein